MEADSFGGVQLHTSAQVGTASVLERVAIQLRQRGSSEDFATQLGLSVPELLVLHYHPRFTLRPVQRPPLDYRTFFFMGGRGAGKTHAGSCIVIEEAMADPDARIMVVGPTYSEIVKTQLEGPSGILTLCPPWFQPKYEKARRKLTFPNGAQVTWLPAQNPDKFRGHADSLIWADEIVAWKKEPEQVYRECLAIRRLRTSRMRRLELSARLVITTTPAPTPLFRQVLEDKEGLVLARSSTMENSLFLDPAYVRYARSVMNTTEGRREFLGELQFDLDATMFRRVDWERSRLDLKERPERFDRLFVSIDPATGEKNTNDYHGIVVVGIREVEGLDHAYVLADLSLRSPEPSAWARKAVEAFRAWESFADRSYIHAETNTGGSMVKQVIRQIDADVPIKTIRANNSKAERAAPVSALAEAGLVHLCGKFHELERQLCTFTGAHNHRDGRVDAMVWPIYRWVARNRRNMGALGEDCPQQDENGDDLQSTSQADHGPQSEPNCGTDFSRRSLREPDRSISFGTHSFHGRC